MKNLVSLRKNAGFSSQEEFAKAFGISKSTYSNYECGANEPSTATLLKLADYFDCSVDYLLGHKTKGILHLDSFTPKQRNLIELISILNDRFCDKTEAYINGLIEGEQTHIANKNKFLT